MAVAMAGVYFIVDFAPLLRVQNPAPEGSTQEEVKQDEVSGDQEGNVLNPQFDTLVDELRVHLDHLLKRYIKLQVNLNLVWLLIALWLHEGLVHVVMNSAITHLCLCEYLFDTLVLEQVAKLVLLLESECSGHLAFFIVFALVEFQRSKGLQLRDSLWRVELIDAPHQHTGFDLSFELEDHALYNCYVPNF